jgi:hypothetical protein
MSNGLTASVNSLSIAASKPSILYAGTQAGVFVSANSAVSWTSAGLAQDDILQVQADPTKAGIAYAVAIVSSDAFVAKLNSTGGQLIYSTYLGGTGTYARGVAAASNGDAVVTGFAGSPNFPTTPGAFQALGNGGGDAFLTRITAAAAPCSYSATPSSYFSYPAGGPANFSVVSPSGCKWTPTPSAPWITVTSHGGPGVGPLTIGIAANTGAARTGTIAVGSAAIGISQPAAGCSYALSTSNLDFPQAGGTQSLNVTAGTGCQWIVTGLPFWLTAPTGASGTGSETVTLQAASSPFNYRAASVTIANNAVLAIQYSADALSH